MEIKILQQLKDIEKQTGLVVIIDVFRAFTLECYVFDNDVKDLIVTDSIDEAFMLKNNIQNSVLIGERHGKIIDGFDYGNSPSAIENISFKNKTVIHTTSAGTKGIINAKNAKEILTGSLVNAKAIANYIKNSNFKEISLICMGLEALEETEEDTLCALYIKSLILGDEIHDMDKRIENLKYTSGAKFFDIKQNDIFPRVDFYRSTELNKFNFILRVNKIDNLNHIEKILM